MVEGAAGPKELSVSDCKCAVRCVISAELWGSPGCLGSTPGELAGCSCPGGTPAELAGTGCPAQHSGTCEQAMCKSMAEVAKQECPPGQACSAAEEPGLQTAWQAHQPHHGTAAEHWISVSTLS